MERKKDGEMLIYSIFIILGIAFLVYMSVSPTVYANNCPHGIHHGEEIGENGKRICPKCQAIFESEQEIKKAQIDRQNEIERAKLEGEKRKKYITQYNLQRKTACMQLENARANMSQIMEMSPREFEHYIAHLLNRLGYTNIVQTPYSNDGGKDIVCKKREVIYYVECKHYSPENPIGRPMIQKLAGAMIADDVSKGIFITTSYYTKEAIAVSERLNIKLIDGNKLSNTVASLSGNLKTYELTCPECGEKVIFQYFDYKEKTCSRGHVVHGVHYVYHNTGNKLIYRGDLQRKQMGDINRRIPKEVLNEVNALSNKAFSNRKPQLGLCHEVWHYKMKLFDERGYMWFSPSELNPDCFYD